MGEALQCVLNVCLFFSFSGSGEAFKWMPELESPCTYLRRYVELSRVFGSKISMHHSMCGTRDRMF